MLIYLWEENLMKKEFVTLKVDNDVLDRIRKDYESFLCPNNGEYIEFFARTPNFVVTAYKSNTPNSFKVTFIGDDALNAAKVYDENASVIEEKPKAITFWIDTNTQLGSDEVGTGDFFGPISVVATLLTKQDIQEIKELGIDDSKKMTDKAIKELVPSLLKKYRYCQLCCSNEKYNEMIEKGFNLNKIKAYLHNQALLHLSNKYKGNYPTYVDQFCPENTYYEYLKGAKEVKDKIVFRTKGESYYPSIALASCIARYAFLIKMDQLKKEYGMAFPLGASIKVDEFAKKFILKFGKDELRKVCKMNFKNYDKAIKE